MKRKQLTAALGLLTVGATFALAGCSSSTGSDSTSTSAACDGTPVSLSVSSWRTEDVDTYNDDILTVFEKANPCIDVTFDAPVVNTEYNQWLTTALAGSDGPDVAMVRAYGGLQGWTADLQPLDDVVDGLDDIAPAVLQGSKGVDGKVYSVPTVTQTMQMFYNKDIFKQYDLKVPTTWAQFIKVEDTLLDKGVVPMALGAKDGWVLPLVSDILGAARYGGNDFEKAVTSGETTFSDPDYVAALQILKDQQKYFNMPESLTGVSYTDAQTEFASGLAAMYPGGTFELTTFTTSNPDIELGTFPVPTPPKSVSDKPVVPAYADGGWAISAHLDKAKQDAAEALVKWFATPEFGQLVADKLHMFSAIPGVTYSDPVMKTMQKDYEASPVSYLTLVNYRYCNPTADSILATDIQKMFLGQKTAQETADDVAAGVSTCTLPTF